MHPNPHSPEFKLASTRELLLLGFEKSMDDYIRHFPIQNSQYQYTLESDSFLAFLWLGKRVDSLSTFHLPYAVLCDLDWLIKHQYRLAQQMAGHPDLCSVPLIAFTQKGKPANKNTLAIHGVDDCYTIPVDWENLERRLDFLNQYKPKLLVGAQRHQTETFHFRIPWQKRLFDLIGASIGIAASSFIWIPVMLAIWLESKGPVVYKSLRVGSGYRVFEFFKFRSMYLGAEEQLTEVQYLNRYANGAQNGKPIFVKLAGDPRTTRVGRFIRKYSIDELPQLINVLRGDMSLVGNRPLPIYEAETLTKDEWINRFIAPAGITGLWQTTKRHKPHMSAEERISLDIEYSKAPYSVLYDLKIALNTLFAFVQKDDV